MVFLQWKERKEPDLAFSFMLKGRWFGFSGIFATLRAEIAAAGGILASGTEVSDKLTAGLLTERLCFLYFCKLGSLVCADRLGTKKTDAAIAKGIPVASPQFLEHCFLHGLEVF